MYIQNPLGKLIPSGAVLNFQYQLLIATHISPNLTVTLPIFIFEEE